MNWIKEHLRLFSITIVIIILVAIVVVSSSSEGNIVERAVQGTVANAEEPLSDATNGITTFFGGLFHFRSIQRENYQLKQEIENLNEQLTEAQLTQSELQELRSIQNALNYSEYANGYTKVTADVIALDGSDMFNIFTINAGTQDGIDKDDMVVNADGLIGRVTSVGSDWAKVLGVVDSTNSVSFTVMRDMDIVGVVSGDGAGALSGYIFDESKSIIEGDILVTSGMGYYPAGIQIGEVTAVNVDSNSKEKIVQAESAVNFNSIKIVTVLTDQAN